MKCGLFDSDQHAASCFGWLEPMFESKRQCDEMDVGVSAPPRDEEKTKRRRGEDGEEKASDKTGHTADCAELDAEGVSRLVEVVYGVIVARRRARRTVVVASAQDRSVR